MKLISVSDLVFTGSKCFIYVVVRKPFSSCQKYQFVETCTAKYFWIHSDCPWWNQLVLIVFFLAMKLYRSLSLKKKGCRDLFIFFYKKNSSYFPFLPMSPSFFLSLLFVYKKMPVIDFSTPKSLENQLEYQFSEIIVQAGNYNTQQLLGWWML